MQWKGVIIFIVLACLLRPGVTAQNKKKDDKVASELLRQPGRIEFDLGESDQDEYVIHSCEKEGLAVYRQTEVKSKDGHLWSFMRLDTTLSLLFRRDFYLPFGSQMLGYDYSPGFVYYLMQEKSYKQDELTVIRMNLNDGDTTLFYMNTVFPVNLTQFEVVGSTILLGGYANYRPVVLRYNLFDQKPQVIPGFYDGHGEIIRIDIDDRLRTFTVTTSEKTRDKRNTVSVRSFTETGEMIRNIQLQPDESKGLLNGAPARLETDRQFVAGTYSDKRSTYSRGIYIATIGSDGSQKIDYFNYGDLQNFFSYMTAKRQQRIKDRISRRKIKSKKIRFNYRLLVHDIIQNGDQYILYGEAYYPRYSSNYSSGYGPVGSYSSRNDFYSNPNFLGYKYTHAVVVAFDATGKLLWDNSFEINDISTYNLQQFVNVDLAKDEAVLLYTFENVIRSKVIRSGEIVEGKTFNDIKLTFEDDELKNSDQEIGGLSKWYQNSFFTYGIQNIKNLKDNKVSLNRKVFFINKVVYR